MRQTSVVCLIQRLAVVNCTLRITRLTDIHQMAHYYRYCAYATPRGRIACIASMRPIAPDIARSVVSVFVDVLCTYRRSCKTAGPALSSNDAAARRSAENACIVTLIADAGGQGRLRHTNDGANAP